MGLEARTLTRVESSAFSGMHTRDASYRVVLLAALDHR